MARTSLRFLGGLLIFISAMRVSNCMQFQPIESVEKYWGLISSVQTDLDTHFLKSSQELRNSLGQGEFCVEALTIIMRISSFLKNYEDSECDKVVTSLKKLETS